MDKRELVCRTEALSMVDKLCVMVVLYDTMLLLVMLYARLLNYSITYHLENTSTPLPLGAYFYTIKIVFKSKIIYNAA